MTALQKKLFLACAAGVFLTLGTSCYYTGSYGYGSVYSDGYYGDPYYYGDVYGNYYYDDYYYGSRPVIFGSYYYYFKDGHRYYYKDGRHHRYRPGHKHYYTRGGHRYYYRDGHNYRYDRSRDRYVVTKERGPWSQGKRVSNPTPRRSYQSPRNRSGYESRGGRAAPSRSRYETPSTIERRSYDRSRGTERYAPPESSRRSSSRRSTLNAPSRDDDARAVRRQTARLPEPTYTRSPSPSRSTSVRAAQRSSSSATQRSSSSAAPQPSARARSSSSSGGSRSSSSSSPAPSRGGPFRSR